MPQTVERLRRQVVTADKWLTHAIDAVKLPSGKVLGTYHVISFPTNSVAIVLEDMDGRVLLLKTPRYPSNTVEWEIPTGAIELGEQPEEAVRREVFEETGLRVSGCSLLCSFQPMNDLTSKTVFMYMGTVAPGKQKLDENEVTDAHWFSPSELENMVASNEIKDAATLIGLLRYWW